MITMQTITAIGLIYLIGINLAGYIIITYCYMHIDTSKIHAETDIRNLLRVCYSSVNTKD
jgi:hypothetical protein